MAVGEKLCWVLFSWIQTGNGHRWAEGCFFFGQSGIREDKKAINNQDPKTGFRLWWLGRGTKVRGHKDLPLSSPTGCNSVLFSTEMVEFRVYNEISHALLHFILKTTYVTALTSQMKTLKLRHHLPRVLRFPHGQDAALDSCLSSQNLSFFLLFSNLYEYLAFMQHLAQLKVL